MIASLRALSLTVVLLLPACHQADAEKGPAVARADGLVLSARELQSRIDALPAAQRARLASPEERRGFVEAWATFELAAREAEREGLAPEGAPGEDGRRRMVQRLVVRRFHDPDGPRTVPEAEVRAYYEANLDRYVQPVKMRVAHVTLLAPAGSPGRKAVAAEARRIRERIAARGADAPEAFEAEIVALDRYRKADAVAASLGLLSRDELSRAFTPEVADAAWALPPGVPSAVLESPQGFHVLMGSGGQPALDVTLEQARGGIQVILYQQRMAEEYRRWTARLREQAGLRIDDAELARIRVDLPASPAGG